MSSSDKFPFPDYFWIIIILVGVLVFYCLCSILDKTCSDRRQKKKERKEEERKEEIRRVLNHAGAPIALGDLEAQRGSAARIGGGSVEALGDGGTGIKTPPPAYCR